jgi:hypothetical protein
VRPEDLVLLMKPEWIYRWFACTVVLLRVNEHMVNDLISGVKRYLDWGASVDWFCRWLDNWWWN